MSLTNEHKTRPVIGAGERSVAAAARGGSSTHRAHGTLVTTADAGGLYVDLLRFSEKGHSCWRPRKFISADVITGKELGPYTEREPRQEASRRASHQHYRLVGEAARRQQPVGKCRVLRRRRHRGVAQDKDASRGAEEAVMRRQLACQVMRSWTPEASGRRSGQGTLALFRLLPPGVTSGRGGAVNPRRGASCTNTGGTGTSLGPGKPGVVPPTASSDDQQKRQRDGAVNPRPGSLYMNTGGTGDVAWPREAWSCATHCLQR
ncbi:hypothetical protein MTO96_006678 [Rhipicephalus appendiculatus]